LIHDLAQENKDLWKGNTSSIEKTVEIFGLDLFFGEHAPKFMLPG
jgi:hypothetical protein